MYSTAPFFRAYFEVLGLSARNIVFSPVTSEELWLEGGKYGSVDPCFPSKVAQAHIHQLLFREHAARPLDAIFFPIVLHVPTFLKHTLDSATCPVAAGTPDVIKAAFTKEQDYFRARNVAYLDPALSFNEPVRMKRRLFEVFRDLLEITEDENDFAVDEAWLALERFDRDVQAQGKALLEQVEADSRLAILVIGRPYHLDPGLHHGMPDEFQLQGYPILSIRSIPKDEAWLARFFADDLRSGRVRTPLEIGDVWPENYSANSAMKVWAAKFAARHPNVVLLDLSSFKCGHDAPTYGIIDAIAERAALPRLSLHEIDGNKPGGSLQIRVKTYVHSLRRHEERRAQQQVAERELARQLDEKLLALLRDKQRQLSGREPRDAALEK
jgi:predicted nucleotide-binding protein (sugar kinase/HSP70/actin superfamily)